MATQYTAGLTSGQTLTAAIMNQIGAAWESYTPTVTQSGTVTATVTYAKYAQIQKIAIVAVRLDVTGTGTTNNAVTVSLPLTAAVTSGLKIGGGAIYDASTATQYSAVPNLATTTSVNFAGDWSGGGVWGTSPNLAIANTDQISFTVVYEVA